MSNANIEEIDNTIITTQKLSSTERRKLKSKVTGHGKLRAVAIQTGLHRHTIYNAIDGRGLKTNTYKLIIDFLNTK